MYGQEASMQLKWIIGTFVGFFIDMIVFETLIAVLSKTADGGSRECCKRRGIYFDFDIYDKIQG